MSEEEIIKYWRKGYSVEQIVNKSDLAKKMKNNENIKRIIQNRIEKTILKYQTGGKNK